MEIIVDSYGIRLDKYLIDKCDMSRSKIQKLINDEKILVNGRIVKVSYTVKEDDVITILDSDDEICIYQYYLCNFTEFEREVLLDFGIILSYSNIIIY